MTLSISFHGAINSTTGTAHIIEFGGKKILLDCGMIQGKSILANYKFSFNPKDIDSVVLSHAHIDHSGRLPLLFKQGYEGPVFCTAATKDLARILMLDSIEVSKEELERELKNKTDKIEPLYTETDVNTALKHFITIPYGKEKPIEKNVSLTLLDAGHILGSSQILLDCNGKKIGFTGDLGQNGMPLIRNPEPLPEIDFLIIESTYANRIHPTMDSAIGKLTNYAKHITKQGGKLLIPSFAIGRTQTILYYLNEIFENDVIERTPVYIDSPMAIDATEIYLKHPDCFDKEALKLIKSGDNPLKFNELKFSRTENESKEILNNWETCIVIAGSGMCTGGRILKHLINELPTKKSILLFVGFQSKGTLGRQLVDGVKTVVINNKIIQVKAQINSVEGFSAHADKSELKVHIEKLPRKPEKIFVVHGEAEQSLSFAAELRNLYRVWAHVPELHQEYSLKT